MYKKHRSAIITVLIVLGAGAGFSVSFSAFAEELKEKTPIPFAGTADSATATPIAPSAPGFVSAAQSIKVDMSAAAPGTAISAPNQVLLNAGSLGLESASSVFTAQASQAPGMAPQTLSPASGATPISIARPDIIQSALAPVSVAPGIDNSGAVFEAQLPNLYSAPSVTAISGTQTDLIQSALGPMNQEPGIQISEMTNPLALHQPMELQNTGSVVSLSGPIGPSAITPAHSFTNVLALPSEGTNHHPEGNALIDAGDTENAISPAVATEAKAEADSLMSYKTAIKGEDPDQRAQKLVKTQIQEHVSAGEVTGKETPVLSESTIAISLHWSEKLTGSCKIVLKEVKTILMSKFTVLKQEAERNRGKARKMLPVLRQLVVNTPTPPRALVVKAGKDTLVQNKLVTKAKNLTLSTRKLVKELIKGQMSTGKFFCRQIRTLSGKLSANVLLLHKKTAENLKSAFIDAKTSVFSDINSFIQKSGKNLAKVRKVLPVLKKFVFKKHFPVKTADDTDDTVEFTYPATIVRSKDPCEFIALFRRMLNPGPISKITQFIDYLKPINDHFIQNGLSPPWHCLILCIRTYSSLIHRLYSGRAAFALGKLLFAYRFVFLHLLITSGFFCRELPFDLRHSPALSFCGISSYSFYSSLSRYSRKPIMIGFFHFGPCVGTGPGKFIFTGGDR